MTDTQESNAAARAFGAPKLRYTAETHELHAAALLAQTSIVDFARELNLYLKELNQIPQNALDSETLPLALAWILENTEGGELRFIVQTETPLAAAPPNGSGEPPRIAQDETSAPS